MVFFIWSSLFNFNCKVSRHYDPFAYVLSSPASLCSVIFTSLSHGSNLVPPTGFSAVPLIQPRNMHHTSSSRYPQGPECCQAIIFLRSFSLFDTTPSCLFSPQAFNTAAPDSPMSNWLDSYFTNNTEKNMCNFLHHSYPPTWLWSLSSWHPSHTHVPVKAESCLSPLDFTLLTYSGTFISWQFSPLFLAPSIFPFQKISAISVYDYAILSLKK